MNPLLRMLIGMASLLLSLAAFLLCAGYVLLFTEPGSRFVLAQLESRVAGLRVATMEGTLAEGLLLQDVSWEEADAGVRVARLELAGNAACLARATLCLPLLRATAVQAWARPGPPADRHPPELLLPIGVETGRVEILGFAWHDTPDPGQPVLALDSLHLTLAARGRRVRVRDLELVQQDLLLRGTAETRLAAPWPLEARLELAMPLPPASRAHLPSDRLELQLQAAGPLENLRVEARSTHPLAAQARGSVNLLPALPSWNLQIEAPAVEWQGDGLRVLAETMHISLQGEGPPRRFDAELALKTLHVSGQPPLPPGKVSLSATLPDAGSARDVVLRYEAASRQHRGEWSGRLQWAPQLAAEGRLQLHTDTLGYWAAGTPGRLSVRAATQLQESDAATQLTFHALQASGTVQGRPTRFQADAMARIFPGTVEVALQGGRLEYGPARANLAGTLLPALSLSGDWQVANLAGIDPALHGRGTGRYEAVGEPARPRIAIHGELLDAGRGTVSAARISIDGQVHLSNAVRLEVDSKIHGLSGLPAALPLTEATLHAHGVLPALQVIVAASGEQSALEVRATAGPGRQDGDAAWVLQQAMLRTPHLGEWAPPAPAQLYWDAARASLAFVDTLCLAAEAGRLCMEPGSRLFANGDTARLRVERIGPAAWAPFLPAHLAIEDTLEGAGEVRFTTGRPTLEVTIRGGPGQLRVHDPASDVSVTHAYSSLRFSGRADGAGAHSELTLDSDSLGAVRARAGIAGDNAELDGNIQISGFQLAPLRPFLPGVETLGGSVDADLQLSGRTTAPEVSGTAQLREGRVGGSALPLQVSDLALAATLSGQSLTFEGGFDTREGEEVGLSGQTFGGRAQVSGSADWSGPDWQLEARFDGKELRAQIGGHSELVLDAGLETRVSPRALFADGRAYIHRGRIRLPKQSADGVWLADDVIVVPAPEAAAPARPLPFEQVQTRLRLDLGPQLEFSGFGVDGWLGGELEITDLHAEAPRGRGGIDIRNGRYRAYGQRLDLRRGRLRFRGDLEAPNLDIEAVRTLDAVVAGVRVRGPASEPQVTLFSEPPLPDEEILSWLVLGKPLGAGTAQDSQLLSAALLSYGLRGGEEMGGRLADRLGISQFEVGTSGADGESGVYASGYLSPRLFVRYGVSGVEAANSLTLRYRILPQLFLEASSGLETAVDLLYSLAF